MNNKGLLGIIMPSKSQVYPQNNDSSQHRIVRNSRIWVGIEAWIMQLDLFYINYNVL